MTPGYKSSQTCWWQVTGSPLNQLVGNMSFGSHVTLCCSCRARTVSLWFLEKSPYKVNVSTHSICSVRLLSSSSSSPLHSWLLHTHLGPLGTFRVSDTAAAAALIVSSPTQTCHPAPWAHLQLKPAAPAAPAALRVSAGAALRAAFRARAKKTGAMRL